jgi:hypothetical protein
LHEAVGQRQRLGAVRDGPVVALALRRLAPAAVCEKIERLKRKARAQRSAYPKPPDIAPRQVRKLVRQQRPKLRGGKPLVSAGGKHDAPAKQPKRRRLAAPLGLEQANATRQPGFAKQTIQRRAGGAGLDLSGGETCMKSKRLPGQNDKAQRDQGRPKGRECDDREFEDRCGDSRAAFGGRTPRGIAQRWRIILDDRRIRRRERFDVGKAQRLTFCAEALSP